MLPFLRGQNRAEEVKELPLQNLIFLLFPVRKGFRTCLFIPWKSPCT